MLAPKGLFPPEPEHYRGPRWLSLELVLLACLLQWSFWIKDMRAVLTPGDPYMPLSNDEIIERVQKQVLDLFTSSRGLEVLWSSVVKIGQSLYHEAPGKDPFRPDQKTPEKNFFLAGSYTKQDYIDSMEGATLSGRQAAAYICSAGEELVALLKEIGAAESDRIVNGSNTADKFESCMIDLFLNIVIVYYQF
ncbi:hypothetical protein QJS10_CPB22g01275 [Acorus calamus]|uniref:Amine oxidase domain-containing protein n=1 Tax=Acorus calamus TaxID=4465 RepID=A0AAV9C1U6_ACOCL|nr:hypothetical protein QJS10_CPB22g01275 [Acorus calamus]